MRSVVDRENLLLYIQDYVGEFAVPVNYVKKNGKKEFGYYNPWRYEIQYDEWLDKAMKKLLWEEEQMRRQRRAEHTEPIQPATETHTREKACASAEGDSGTLSSVEDSGTWCSMDETLTWTSAEDEGHS